jgi:serine/threonine-protein kinase
MQTCPNCQASVRPQAHFCSKCGTAMPPGPQALLTGMLPADSVLHSRYVVVKLIDKGGMAAVYQVTDLHLPGAQWAVKEMSNTAISDPAERQRAVAAFRQEAQLLASLSHPNLPRVVDSFSQDGKQYLVMEYVDGETLEQIASSATAPLDEGQVLSWMVQLCGVLTYLHGRQPPVIFRDLKPANIMMDRQGRLKLIDFGIARHFKPGQTNDTQPMGTPGYAAPEAYGRGQSDARSDLYSLGVTLHALLTGHDPGTTPFHLPPIRKLAPRASEQVETIVQRATQMDPASRYQSAVEMKQALLHAAGQLAQAPTHAASPAAWQAQATARSAQSWTAPTTPVSQTTRPKAVDRTPPRVAPPAQRKRRKLPVLLAVGGSLLLCLAVVGIGLFWMRQRILESSLVFESPAPSVTLSDSSVAPSRTPVPSPTEALLPPTATLIPTATKAPLPPTATLVPTPAATPVPACAFGAQGAFAGLWQTYRGRLGCPYQERPQAIQDAEQPFQNGHMLWRMDNPMIYVIYEQGARAGTYQAFPDRWREGDPEFSCPASPPGGLEHPKRGFGLVWCQLGGAGAPIGWGLQEERGFSAGNGDPQVQDFEGGTIFRDSEGTARGMAYVLFADGTFVRAQY